MQGKITNFRRGRHVTRGNQMLVKIEGIDSKEKASSLKGKKVVWKSTSGKEITGKISEIHGNKGAVRVVFETGMPGQAIGNKVDII